MFFNYFSWSVTAHCELCELCLAGLFITTPYLTTYTNLLANLPFFGVDSTGCRRRS